MKENSIVRENLMTNKEYAPYCGNETSICETNNPRTKFNGEQFVCPKCGWTSRFPDDFILRYKQKHNIK